MDFWPWVAIIGLALTALGVSLGVIVLVFSGRPQGSRATLIAGAEERTQRILTRMETNAEARYRDLKDHLDGEAESHG